MKRSSYIWVSLLLCVMLLTTGLSSCTKDGKHYPHLPKEPKVATCEPGRWGGSLKFALSGVPLTFNPYLAMNPDTYEITSKLYGTLLDYDYAGDKPANDGLARSVDSLGDKRTYVINLREGAAFSNGSPITADDVVFSFTVALDTRIGSVYGDMMRIDGQPPKLIKDDTYKVRITFADHYEPIKMLLAKVPIISRSSMEEAYLKGNFKEIYTLDTPIDRIVSSGPFVLAGYKPDKEVNLKYNEYYYKVDTVGTALPYVDTVDYYLKTQRQEQGYNLLTKNELSAAQVLPKDLAQFTGNPRFVAKDVGPMLRTWQLVFNWRADKNKILPERATWFRTPGFRWAISSAINREQLVKEVLESMGKVAFSPISVSNENWYTDKITKYDYNPSASKNFLSSLKYVMGDTGFLKDVGKNTVRFDIVHINEYVPNQIASRLVEDLKSIGIQVETHPQENKRFWSLLNGGLFDVALVETSPMFSDPAFLHPYLNKYGKYFWFYEAAGGDSTLRGVTVGGTEGWMDRVVKNMNEAVKKSSVQERQELYKEVQAEWTDRAPVIYLMNEDMVYAAQSSLGNFKPARVEPALTWNIEEFYLKK